MEEYILNNITPISTYFILGVFLFFMIEAIKLLSIYRTFNKACKSDNGLETLSKSKMAAIVTAYEQSMDIETERGKKTNIPSAEFFSEFNACKARKVNLRMLDTASGTLVGLGLLGTFLGLTLGIQGFDSSNTDNIQKSIQTLLNGMGTAFMTSLVGMSLSLLFTLLDKSWRNRLVRRLYEFTEKLDSIHYIDDFTLNTLNQQKIVKDLYANIKNMLEVQTTAIIEKSERTSLALQEKLVYANNEGEVTTIGNAIREILTENTEQTKALKSFSTDLAIELNNGFDESLSRQMQQKILPLMENVDITTKAIVEHIDKMADQVSSPATDLIQNVITELKTSMSSIMEGMSGSATAGLENLAEQLGTATQAIGDLPRNMEAMSATLQATIEEVKGAVADISNTSATANTTVMQRMQEQITFATTAISNSITEVKEVMNGITNTSREQSRQMADKLAEAAEKMGNYLDNTINVLSSFVQNSVKGISEDMARKQEGLLTLQSDMMQKMEAAMNGMTQTSQEQNGRMVSNLSEASDKMGRFLNEILTSLSTTMQNSMKSVTDDMSNKQVDLLTLQEETTAQTRRLLETFNQGLERLEKMNEHIAGTMNTFQQAQGQITGSTAHLQTITNDMKLATQQFGKSQAEYSSRMEEMQRSSKKGVEEVFQLLNDTGDMTNDYVEKFEIIKQGIGSIFTQLQNGLSEYSRTVQTTTQKYLDQYSSSLTSTTDALSSAIQQQNEVVEMLVESLNSRKN